MAMLLLLLGACDPGDGGSLPGPGPTPDPGPEPSPPGAMLLELVPSAPTSSEDFAVEIIQAAVDPDDDITGVRYTWWVDGVIQVVLTDLATIPAEETLRGQVWEVRAYAIDSLGQVGPESAAQVTIGNSVPTVPVVTIQPSDPAPGLHTLRCQVDEPATDVDEDTLTYTFSWSVDGQAYPEADPTWIGPATDEHKGDSIPPEDTAPSQHWICSVRASDGEAEGGEAIAVVTVGDTPVQPDFALADVNETSATFGLDVSPRDYLEKVSGWYFGHAT